MPKTIISVDDARTKAEESRIRYESLVERLRGGDLSVTERDLTRAHSAWQYATLAIEGAEAAERKARDDAARAASDEIQTRIEKELRPKGRELAERLSAATSAIGELIDATTEYRQTHLSISSELSALIPSTDYGPDDVPEYASRFKRWGRGLVDQANGSLFAEVRSLPLIHAATHAAYRSRPEATRSLQSAEGRAVEDAYKPDGETRALLDVLGEIPEPSTKRRR